MNNDYEGVWAVGVLLITLASCTLIGIILQTISIYLSTKTFFVVLAICVLVIGISITKYANKKIKKK